MYNQYTRPISKGACFENVNRQGNLIVGPIFSCIWILFSLTHQSCFFSLVLFAIFSSCDFLWHATDSIKTFETLHCIWFALNAMMINQMLDETVLRCIHHENLVGWTRKCWTKSLIENKLHPTLSNTIFVSSQMHLTFRPTLKIYGSWRNIGCICVRLYFSLLIRYFWLRLVTSPYFSLLQVTYLSHVLAWKRNFSF